MRLSFPPKDELFFDVTVGGVRFAAGARGDPYVTDGVKQAQLGSAAHVLFLTESADSVRFKGAGWYVCKYGPSEIKMHLRDFGKADAQVFAEVFGMDFGESDGPNFFFWESPAGAALAEYFEQYPRRIKRCWWNYMASPLRRTRSA